MSQFNDYAQYYDLLNAEKNYTAEVDYICSLINRYKTNCSNILEIGVGTGRHAELLTKQGYAVSGVEKSEKMAVIAQNRNPEMNIQCVNMSEFQFDTQFDAILSLFHVMSYQTDTNALLKTFMNIRQHLNKDGIFIFDCWHGPAVLSQQPQVKIRKAEKDQLHITRLTTPILKSDENIVDVHFDFIIKDNEKYSEMSELHSMRYFFKPELELLLVSQGLSIIAAEEWLTGKAPDLSTWGVTYIIKAVS
ncbi:class I SAM-dependent DNA methyltransferase [Aliikangiella sp. IMCC44359]|uniref:class I SAM-dependent DNA methyltransferase n=1 Tax=Aliikangiella sp. IMCC44359 TaxID=3459125 RepID=UPI00403A8122